MQQQCERQDQTNRTLPVILGFAEPLTYVHQWAFPHQDTPSSDPREEAPPEEEVEEDSQEEEVVDSQEEEAVGSQEEEDPCRAIPKEDRQETD